MAAFTGPTIRLAARKARPTWYGHPWVRAAAIGRNTTTPSDGDLVCIADERGAPIDFALWSGQTAIRARTLGVGPSWPQEWPADVLPGAFWEGRVADACALRRALGLPCEDTDVYRLLNGEGDFVPGVFADVFGDVVVVQLTTIGAYLRRDAVVDALVGALRPRGVLLTTDAAAAAREGMPVISKVAFGDAPEAVDVVERGLRYRITPGTAQKTGHYADQREHRRHFGALAAGVRALDLHCYTGGFALAAARGGAASVVAVDSSAEAIRAGEVNGALNGSDAILWVREKVERFLDDAKERGERWDLISLDPPKLAPSHKSVERAQKKVEALVAQALHVLAPGGRLVLTSCSHHIGPQEMAWAVASAGVQLGRAIRVVGTTTQPADHPYPVAMPEGRYLSALWLVVA